MKYFTYSMLCIITFCSIPPLEAAELPNSGLNWSNYDGTFSNPVTSSETNFESITSGSLLIPTSINVDPIAGSANEVGNPIRANGGGVPTQSINKIKLNSIFFKPNNTNGDPFSNYSLTISGEGGGSLPAGNSIYVFSIANLAGTSTSVKLTATNTGGSLITDYIASEINVDESAFQATNTLDNSDPFSTVTITNGTPDTTLTNTKPLRLTFFEDLKSVTLEISAINVGGAYDGFNFGAAAVPEPSTYLLMGSALVGVFILARRRAGIYRS